MTDPKSSTSDTKTGACADETASAASIDAAFPDALLSGYGRYCSQTFIPNRRALHDLAIYGQKPKVMIIGCCDSRVTPEAIFDTGPGELFVVRNVANLVPPYEEHGDYHGTSAALEFAVQALKVEHVIVLGHARCGGVAAFRAEDAEPLSPGDFIGKWITLLQPAAKSLACNPVDRTTDPQQAMEFAGVRQSLKNLRTFPCVRILEEKGRLRLHGAWFDIGTGQLKVMDADSGQFADVETSGAVAAT